MTTSRDLETLIQKFISGVQKAVKASIPRGRRKINWVPYWRYHSIDELIRERDAAGHEFEKNNRDENRRNHIDISRKVEDEITALINVLSNRCNEQNYGSTFNAISSCGHTSKTDRQTANLLVQHYEQASKLNFSREDRKQKKIYRQALNQSKSYNQNDDFSNDITLEELDSAISSLDPKKSPGIDLIFGSMIKHFGVVLARSILLKIFNLSWSTDKLLSIWKNVCQCPCF
ncbi:reverse transcriptase domain-containing protein [Trichonephila clavipes]|nr:reverse transcriptase domain-containing protein [Trichonephila clavipes]